MSIATLEELRAELIVLEERIDAGAFVDSDRLRALAPAARHWARQSDEAHPIPRLARLMMRTNASSAARDLLEFARPIARDEDCSIALMLANATAACGDHRRALAILAPLADANSANAQLAARAAELHARLGNAEESLRLYARAAKLDKGRKPQLLNALIAAGRGGDALDEARKALVERQDDPATRIAWFKALAKFSGDRDEIARARADLLAWLPDDLAGSLWRAHLFRMEQDDEAAFAELNAAFARWPNDGGLRKARAAAALALGFWGRDAGAIYDAVSVSLDAPDLRAQIARADKLLRAFGGSLGKAAADSGAFAHVRSPESVFALVADEKPAAPESGRGKGLAMIAHSLTAGGADRGHPVPSPARERALRLGQALSAQSLRDGRQRLLSAADRHRPRGRRAPRPRLQDRGAVRLPGPRRRAHRAGHPRPAREGQARHRARVAGAADAHRRARRAEGPRAAHRPAHAQHAAHRSLSGRAPAAALARLLPLHARARGGAAGGLRAGLDGGLRRLDRARRDGQAPHRLQRIGFRAIPAGVRCADSSPAARRARHRPRRARDRHGVQVPRGETSRALGRGGAQGA